MANALTIGTSGGGKVAVDLPNIVFATALAGWVAWYCWDAWHANSAMENMILILPASMAGLLLYFFVLAGCIKRSSFAEMQTTPPQAPMGRGVAIKIVGSMAMLAALVIAGPLIGFDVASFVYMLGMMA